MKKIVLKNLRIEYFPYKEDEAYYYVVQVVEREPLVSKISKKDARVVGQERVWCKFCGFPLGTEMCDYCQSFGNGVYGHKLGYRTSVDGTQDYLVKELNREEASKWHKYCAGKTYNVARHCCLNGCKWFNYHQLNYCYKCGGKLTFIDNISHQEFAELYKDFKAGY